MWSPPYFQKWKLHSIANTDSINTNSSVLWVPPSSGSKSKPRKQRNMFLRNVSERLPDYTALEPRLFIVSAARSQSPARRDLVFPSRVCNGVEWLNLRECSTQCDNRCWQMSRDRLASLRWGRVLFIHTGSKVRGDLEHIAVKVSCGTKCRSAARVIQCVSSALG
jgi:hypothetical protein